VLVDNIQHNVTRLQYKAKKQETCAK